jgi:hypothetical protein
LGLQRAQVLRKPDFHFGELGELVDEVAEVASCADLPGTSPGEVVATCP